MGKKKRVAIYDHDAQLRYQAKLKAFTLRIKPEDYERYKAAAGARGESFRGFILGAVEQRIERGE